MAGEVLSVAGENKPPRQSGRVTHNLRVHQISQADKTGRNRCGDGNIVQHPYNVYFCFADVEPQGNNQADGAAVAPQSFLPRKSPSCCRVAERRDDIERMSQIIFRFVEQTMPQTCSDKYTEEAVNK